MPLLCYKTLLYASPELKTPATADFPQCVLSTTSRPGSMLLFSLLRTLLLYPCPVPLSSNHHLTLISTPSVPLTRAASEQCHPIPHLLVQLSPPTLGLSPGISERLQARLPHQHSHLSSCSVACSSGPRLTRPGLLPIPPKPWYLSLHLGLCDSFFLGPWWSFLHFLFVSQKILSTNLFCLKNSI